MNEIEFEQDCFDDDFGGAEETLDMVDDLLNIQPDDDETEEEEFNDNPTRHIDEDYNLER